jgi:hypothetical protein
LKTSELINGDARTEKDVKNEGRTDYVYESTGSSDKKYFGKSGSAPQVSKPENILKTKARKSRFPAQTSEHAEYKTAHNKL